MLYIKVSKKHNKLISLHDFSHLHVYMNYYTRYFGTLEYLYKARQGEDTFYHTDSVSRDKSWREKGWGVFIEFIKLHFNYGI